MSKCIYVQHSHVRKQIYSVGIVCNRCTIDDPQGMQLMAKRLFPDDKLCCVRPVQAVNAVRPRDTILHPQIILLVFATPKKSCRRHYLFGNGLKDSNHILISAYKISQPERRSRLDYTTSWKRDSYPMPDR